MAKKKKNTNTTTTSNYPLVKTLAFYGLILAGIASLLTFIFAMLAKFGAHFDWAGKVTGACSLVAQIAIYISVWLAAWSYARGKSQTYKVLFWVFFVLSLLGLVGLGVNSWL